MLKTLRTLTAVAAIAAAGLPQMAQAALVNTTLDFEGVGTLATHYNQGPTGFTTILGTADLTTTAGSPSNPSSTTNNALYNICGDQSCQNAPITLSIAGGLHVDATHLISFDLFVRDIQVIVEVQINGGGWSQAAVIPTNATVDGWVDPRVTLTGLAAGTYTGIRFTGDARAWALDNLSFQTEDTTTTSVPEPASLALAALALAGAAASRRREKR